VNELPDQDKYSNVLKADVLSSEAGEHYYKGDEVPFDELADEAVISPEKQKQRLGESGALYTNDELEELTASNKQQEEARQAEIAEAQDNTLEGLSERDKANEESDSQEKVSTRGRPKKKA
jgi:hypothetical protein